MVNSISDDQAPTQRRNCIHNGHYCGTKVATTVNRWQLLHWEHQITVEIANSGCLGLYKQKTLEYDFN